LETWDEYKGYLRYWQKKPYPINDFLEEVADVIDRHPELGLREFTEKLADHYPKGRVLSLYFFVHISCVLFMRPSRTFIEINK